MSLYPESLNDDVLRILRLGRLLSSSEEDEISRSLSNLDADLLRNQADIDAELARHQKIIMMLERSRHDLQEKRNRLSSTRSPIRKLHSELLGLIFFFCLGRHGNMFGLPGDTYSVATCLSMVCVHWHNVLLETPYIWAAISIDFGVDRSRLQVMTPAIMRHLALSKQAPLYLNFRDDSSLINNSHTLNEVWPDDLISPLDYLEIFIGELHRWREIAIDVEIVFSQHNENHNRFLSFISESVFPLLETLSVRARTHVREPMLFWIRDCPKLNTLQLHNYHPSLLNITMTQLTHIDVRALGVESCLDAFASCPNVSSASVTLTCRVSLFRPMLGRNHSGQTRGVLRIVAPKLCELHIHLRNEFGYAFTYEPLAKLFRGLECPKLQSLSLTSSGGSSFSGYSQHGHAEQSCRAALIDFITHSDLTSKLRRLAVKEMSMTTTDMIIVLKSLLAITDLTIHDVSVADGRGLSLFGGRSSSNHILVQEFFQEFCVVREDATLPIDSGHDITSPLLPNLYRMELKLADIQEDVKELRRMVHSRWDISCSSPVTRLGCVVVLLTSDGGLPEDEWEDFHRYKKEGMLVKVQRVRGQQVIVGD